MVRKRSKLVNGALFALEKSVWVGATIYDFATYMHQYSHGSPQGAERYEFYQLIWRLRKEGFIEKTKDLDQNKIILKLTEKGQDYLKIENALKNENWDGKWRLVIFDIPESKRRLRNTLRQKLKEWGFKYWQKSLWASKKDIAGPLREFIDELGLSDLVLVAVSSDLSSFSKFTKS